MTARPDTWMPMYWGDYARDTGHLNAAGHGAYLMLIKHYWCTGRPLPDDDDELWRIACCDSKKEWQKLRPKIVRLFVIDGGTLRHKRIDKELGVAVSAVTAKVEAGKKGADSKWGGASVTLPAPAAQGTAAQMRSQRLAAARAKGTHTETEWLRMVAHHEGRCAKCGTEVIGTPVRDHIKPIYRGGSDALENLQPLCRNCNSAKGPDDADHRRDGWQDACQTPGGATHSVSHLPPVNACQTPAPSPSPRKEERTELRSAAGAAPTDARQRLWDEGVPILRSLTGKGSGAARGALGGLLKSARDDCAVVLAKLHAASDLRPADPMAWLTAAVSRDGEKPGKLDYLRDLLAPHPVDAAFDIDATAMEIPT